MWNVLLAIFQWCDLLSSSRIPTHVLFLFGLKTSRHWHMVHGTHVYMYGELKNTAALGKDKRKKTNSLFGCLVTWSLLFMLNVWGWERCKIEATCKMNLFKCLERHAWFWNQSASFVGSCVHRASSALDTLDAVIEFHPLWWTGPATNTPVDLSDMVRLCCPNGAVCLCPAAMDRLSAPVEHGRLSRCV